MTVAEYVENEEVVELLREIGIDYAQGFHWGKPTPEPLLALEEKPQQRNLNERPSTPSGLAEKSNLA